MLDTVLEIGKVLRAAPDGLKHHRYIKMAPAPDERNPVQFWTVSVEFDGSFDFGLHERLVDENRQKHLFYLNYKRSDADSTKPYVFGDLYRSVTKIGEDGNFRFGDPAKKSWMALNSFQRAEDIDVLPTERVRKFRSSFREQIGSIEAFLHKHQNAYIHFDFAGKGWAELEELNLLNRNLLSLFFKQVEHGYVMRSFLFKTLSSGTSRTPGFQPGNEYKSRIFADQDEAMDLLYGVNYSSKAIVRKNDIKVVVLPRGGNLTAKQIERFFERTASGEPDERAEAAEEELRSQSQQGEGQSTINGAPNEGIDEDELFTFLSKEDEGTQSIMQFDFIFSKAGGTQADIDMIEVAGLERSKLSYTSQRVREVRREVEVARQEFLIRLWKKPPKKAMPPLRITQCFLNILSDTSRAKKKYQAHLLKVLPQIYTASYFRDPILLPALVEKTEFDIRNDAPSFHRLKFDFYFLTRLQNYQGDRLMEIQESASYRVGLSLGRLAKQFSGPNSPIKSFEKNYVGLLSRRITTLSDVVKFANEVNQKLVMHDLSKFTFRTSTQLAEELKDFVGRYDKNECAFGFFESYFATLPAKGNGGDVSGVEIPEVRSGQDVQDARPRESQS